MDNITILKKALKHDLLKFFRKAYFRYYTFQNKKQLNIKQAEYSKKRYNENKDNYKEKRIEQISKNYIKKKALENSQNDLEFLLN
jgi:hypothetical protein